MNKYREHILRNIINTFGYKTNRKIVVFESDDWGSIRMPSKLAYSNLLKKGIGVDKSLYDTLDSLEKKEDLEALFTVLQDNKSDHSLPIFTFNTVIQNPDFSKIKENNFEKFYGISLFDSYEKYYGESMNNLWQEAMSQKIMLPQYHAREHVNGYLWLKDLKAGVKDTKIAFENDFFAVKTKTSSRLRQHYLATYFSESLEEFHFVKEALKDGLQKFHELFQFYSKTFIASNYTWPIQLENELFNLGVLGIQGQRKQINTDFLEGKKTFISHYTGSKNKLSQIFTVRNVLFEPYLNQNINWAEKTFREIENALFWKTPAIISSHRVNYASNLNIQNRDNTLKQLNTLLKKINKKYPDVIYMSSAELLDFIKYK